MENVKHLCAFSLEEGLDSANSKAFKCPDTVWAVRLSHCRAENLSSGVVFWVLSANSLGFLEQAALITLWLPCKLEVNQS